MKLTYAAACGLIWVMSERPPIVIPVQLNGGLVNKFGAIANIQGSFFLDSVTTDIKEGRYSFAGYNPIHTLSSKGGFVTIDGRTVIDNPLTALKRFTKLARGLDVEDKYLPFMGGLVGFIGFEWGNNWGALSSDSEIPDLAFGLYDTILTYDHLEKCAFISSFGLKEDGSTDVSLAKSRAEKFAKLLQSGESTIWRSCESYPPLTGKHPVISSLNKDLFIGGVKTLKKEEHLPLFAREFRSPTHKSPWQTYLDIRHENQSAYAAYLNLGTFHILSASRTQLIKIDKEKISVKPTKGYTSRSKDPAEEAKRINNLKYNSEIQGSHRHIVSDVMRNLSVVCNADTIEAQEIAKIESDLRSHHLVSTISGQKLKGATTIDCVLNVMQAFTDTDHSSLISKLERSPRNVYTGTIGFIDVNGSTEFNFAFRTMILKDTIGYLHAGAEIGKETDPEEAYISTESSAKHIFELCHTKSI